MAAHAPTPEQSAIYTAASASSDNLLIEALAGAAKTTTLVELSRHVTGSICCLAFNKKIADEMRERMPTGVECLTLNSLGHRVWGRAIAKRLTLSSGKLNTLLREHIEHLGAGEEADHLWETFADVLGALNASKNSGHVPNTSVARWGRKVTPLCDDAEFFDALPEELSATQKTAILAVLDASFAMAMAGVIDYADQLLMPTVCKCVFPLYENVFVDEAQDLSELNHRMLEKLVKRRIIAVGDSCQAIYAFRGAHEHGMPLLAQRFSMQRLSLSTTFRCASAICEHVRWRVPNISVWEGNPNNPGTINHLTSWNAADVADGTAIICRNNAPLFRTAIRLLRSGRRPNLWGNDVAASLVKILESLGAKNMLRADALAALARYHAEKLARLKRTSAKDALADRVACLRIFIDDAETLGGAITFAKTVLSSAGSVDLCTIHKSKGAEWRDIFILDEFLLGDEGQELNLRYVAATRAKRSVTYVTSEGWSNSQPAII